MPQSIESRAEMKYLMSVKDHLIIGKNGMVQDASLGMYKLSWKDIPVKKTLYFDCILWIKKPFFGENPFQPPFTSRRLISILFPPWLNLKNYVQNGVVIAPLNKKIIRNKILPLIYKKDPQLSLHLLYSIQRLVSEYLRRTGFSVGLANLLPDQPIDLKVKNVNKKRNKWEMACIVRKLKDEKAVEAKSLFNAQNTFIQLTSEGSGAKGSLMNVIQMKANLGQQYVNGDIIKTYRKSMY